MKFGLKTLLFKTFVPIVCLVGFLYISNHTSEIKTAILVWVTFSIVIGFYSVSIIKLSDNELGLFYIFNPFRRKIIIPFNEIKQIGFGTGMNTITMEIHFSDKTDRIAIQGLLLGEQKRLIDELCRRNIDAFVIG